MAKQLVRIPAGEFSQNIERVLARVFDNDEEVVVESAEGKLAVLKPVPPGKKRPRAKTAADLAAFRAAAGGWEDVDIDKFLAENYESRRISSRPAVEL